MKPAYAVLRQLGHINTPYIDDPYLQGGSYEECLANVLDIGLHSSPSEVSFYPYTKISILGVCFGLSPDENLFNK